MPGLPPALVLTAGLGTRLWPLTARVAKPAVPLAGPSIIERILAQLSSQGVREAILNLHHAPDSITAIVGDGSQFGLRVRYSLEPTVLGSAGGPRHALPLIDDDTFLVVNGDTLTEMALAPMVEQHRRSGALVTMALGPLPSASYNGVIVAPDDAVTGFSRAGETTDAWHFVGLQVAHREAFAYLDDGLAIDSVGATYRDLVRTRPGAIRAYRTAARFIDVGRPADYLAAALLLASEPGSGPLVDPRASIAADATVVDSIVWPGARIGPGCRLDHCIVGHVRVPDGLSAASCCLVPAEGLAPRPGDRVIDGCLVAPFA
jgi:NDP-sugar pyrophosphorylase family protein